MSMHTNLGEREGGYGKMIEKEWLDKFLLFSQVEIYFFNIKIYKISGFTLSPPSLQCGLVSYSPSFQQIQRKSNFTLSEIAKNHFIKIILKNTCGKSFGLEKFLKP
jgi:hypothetical protein